MNTTKRTVTETPVHQLWIADTQVDAKRTSYLTRSDIKTMLQAQPLPFVIAKVGESLRWVRLSECYQFWNTEAEKHTADNLNHIALEDFPDNYAFIASKWVGKNHDAIILLEKFH